MEDRFLYFAYGSNMCTVRLQARVPGATRCGLAKMANTMLICNKKSSDGSAKANLTESCGNFVWGVIFSIPAAERSNLDSAEGARGGVNDYKPTEIEVELDNGGKLSVMTYKAGPSTEDQATYHWYKEYIVRGAQEHGLPADYIGKLAEITSKPDPDPLRAEQNRLRA